MSGVPVMVLAFGGLAIGLAGLVVGAIALGQVRRLRQAEISHAQYDARALQRLHAGLDDLRLGLSEALRHVAVVRYDAFGDQAGTTSWSMALLDDAGDGVVVTTINGRESGRAYAKNVRGGASDVPLSPEEKEALNYAMDR
ncbi:DUF4446 family protein [Tenggerimyces flavus]|uniref:DUF4446 family protein n=1 Tax=Tenggerimyces flavus TaxID=1708749 RepID=A0ABV7YGG9_9ACTN|nr:DUF4446 family protein [Tenggerimyces flavus]MBM7784553.1 hypothetical protein [Tenggerimyces flavus]